MTGNNDKITDRNGNNVSHISNISGLLACPFCGSKELAFIKESSKDGTIMLTTIYHNNPTAECGMSMMDSDEEKLVAKWNMRSISFEPTPEQIEQASKNMAEDCHINYACEEAEIYAATFKLMLSDIKKLKETCGSL